VAQLEKAVAIEKAKVVIEKVKVAENLKVEEPPQKNGNLHPVKSTKKEHTNR